jgi:hypothetical protein
MIHLGQFFNQGSRAGSGGGCATIVGATTSAIVNGTSNSNDIPFEAYWNYSVSGIILLASELGSAKQFTGLQIERTSGTAISQLNQTIQLMHVTESEMNLYPAVDLSDLTVSDRTTCYTGSVFLNSSAGYYTVNFGTNFCYNGTDNVAILWENRDGAYTSSYPTFETRTNAEDSNRGMWDYKDSGYGDLVPARISRRYNVKFLY